jgi:hypothetical protein
MAWVVGFVFQPPEVVMGGELFVSVDLETKAVAIREGPSRDCLTSRGCLVLRAGGISPHRPPPSAAAPRRWWRLR